MRKRWRAKLNLPVGPVDNVKPNGLPTVVGRAGSKMAWVGVEWVIECGLARAQAISKFENLMGKLGSWVGGGRSL